MGASGILTYCVTGLLGQSCFGPKFCSMSFHSKVHSLGGYEWERTFLILDYINHSCA